MSLKFSQKIEDSGISDADFISIANYEQAAKKILPHHVYGYYAAGAGDEFTLRDNIAAYQHIRLRPRMLRDVSQVDTSTSFLGFPVSMPIGIAPTAMQRMAHDEGEIATAKAAEDMGTCMIVSTLSTISLDEISRTVPGGLFWFQLYIYKDRTITQHLVQRAERCGFKALVLTVDTPVLGKREIDLRNHFTLPEHLWLANFGEYSDEKAFKQDPTFTKYMKNQLDASVSWEDISWLRSITSLPILLKGIHTFEDASLALDYDIAGIIVSNHGARQLDGVLATIDIVPEVIRVVNEKKPSVEVYIDGGIRRGTDVLKALAMGVRGVFLGRPILWGLACQGQEGVHHVLHILKEELSSSMALSGCTRLSDISSSLITNNIPSRY